MKLGAVNQVSGHGESSDEDSDIQLMGRVAKRDPEAQRKLASRLVDRVRRLSCLLLRSSTDADDAAQVALIEILQSANNFGPPGNLEAWADRITVRTSMAWARRQRNRRLLFKGQIDPEHITARAPDITAEQRTPQPVETYLKRLSRERREAFVLKHALGYTVEEISELTNAPRGTVKDRLVVAKRQLRKMIQHDFQRTELSLRLPGSRNKTGDD